MRFIKANTTYYFLYQILMTLLGTLIMSLSINALMIPNKILSGGITGIAILLKLQLGWGMALTILILNIPIFLLGYRSISKKFIVLSLTGMGSLALFIQATQAFAMPPHDLLTVILLGGILHGLGLGLLLKAGSSTGGNDILSKVLHQKYAYSISTFNFAFNLLIIGLSIHIFGLDQAVQTLTMMYVSSLTSKFILEGMNHKRTILIVSEHKTTLADEINKQLGRGCTLIEGKGFYTGNSRHILYAVIGVTQVAKLKEIALTIDPDAFINVMESHVVFGNGFLNIQDEDH